MGRSPEATISWLRCASWSWPFTSRATSPKMKSISLPLTSQRCLKGTWSSLRTSYTSLSPFVECFLLMLYLCDFTCVPCTLVCVPRG